MKPELTTNCNSIIMPTTLTPDVGIACSTAMMIGILAAARAEALAKPNERILLLGQGIAGPHYAASRPNASTSRNQRSRVADLDVSTMPNKMCRTGLIPIK